MSQMAQKLVNPHELLSFVEIVRTHLRTWLLDTVVVKNTRSCQVYDERSLRRRQIDMTRCIYCRMPLAQRVISVLVVLRQLTMKTTVGLTKKIADFHGSHSSFFTDECEGANGLQTLTAST